MKKPYQLLALLFYVIGAVYLLTPSKDLPVLSSATISNEPGDTVQHPDQRGFYTNMTRQQVLAEVQSKIKISIFGYNIPNYRLNFRPEEAGEMVRDQLKSNYLEEIIYPLHSSVFVNGWEPKKSPSYFKNKTDKTTDLSIYGIPYEAKVTFKPVNSTAIARIIVWTLIFPATYFVFLSFKNSLKNV